MIQVLSRKTKNNLNVVKQVLVRRHGAWFTQRNASGEVPFELATCIFELDMMSVVAGTRLWRFRRTKESNHR